METGFQPNFIGLINCFFGDSSLCHFQETIRNNGLVKIYSWVRNTIETFPTFGSIQGADMALQTKKGNSFDTASLLIGLLRAANIPARYDLPMPDPPPEGAKWIDTYHRWYCN